MIRALIALMIMFAAPAGAVEPDEILADPALEARARGLSAELRCLVCQNQSIDDSDAPLAKDLRILVRERLSAGDTDAEVKKFVVARYGDFVLLRPRFSAGNLLLWLTPIIVLGIGGAVLFRSMRKSASPQDDAPLSAEEQEALTKILDK